LNWASTINAAAIAKVKRTSEAFSDKGYAIGNQEFTVEGKQAYVNKGNLDEVSIIVTTFLRDGYLIPCLERIQMYLPDAKVIVVDDGIPSLKKDGFANYMPFDSGLSAKRNKAVRIARTKYVLLGSDDFDFGGLETRAGIEKLVKLLDENPDIDVAGGRVNNARYEALLEYKKGEYIREHCLITSSNKPTPVDLTVNYFLARTDVIAKFPWPDEMKIGGEHVCFFLDLKLKGRKVVFVPGVNINTFRVRNGADPRYESYRNRAHSLGHALMKKRYGIVDYIDMNGEVS
jgi:glycosyltransferase involved in cell wall biosynthesis